MEEKTKTRFWQSRWLKNMGIGAFLFFTIKGLVWLAVFFGLFKFIGC
ncbi:MAG: hypothetical protein R3301_06925 [Saprospiraceae bacterium]|nr:hypothetical protein [Saprospiraceae bacterium]